jgi:protein-disulfide isomerase
MAFNNYQQVSPMADLSNTDQTRHRIKKHIGRWLGLGLILLVAILVVIFLAAIVAEVAHRDNELKDIIARAQKGTSASIIENKLLTGLAANLASSSQATTTEMIGKLVTVSNQKDPNRQLAEKLNRPQLGNVSSSLVIVEFADFECPICLEEFPIIRTITNKYAQDILFIFRQYPVKDDNSGILAQISVCANEQGKFWALHDRLYSNQGKISTTDDLKNLVTMSGVDWTKLEDCVNSQKYYNQILEDMADALDLGVRGTPTFFINGHKLEGAVSNEVWEQIISKYKELNKNNL